MGFETISVVIAVVGGRDSLFFGLRFIFVIFICNTHPFRALFSIGVPRIPTPIFFRFSSETHLSM